jgi:hypothetical protein
MINLYYSEAYWGHSATMNGPHKVVDNLIKSLNQEKIEYAVNKEIYKNNFLLQYDWTGHVKHSELDLENCIIGPQIWMFDEHVNDLRLNPSYYKSLITPSQWVKDLYVNKFDFPENKISNWPVGIEEFNNIREPNYDCLIYFKRRDQSELDVVKKFLVSNGLSYRMVEYGGYSEDGFKQLVNSAKFCFLINGTESQGIAVQEIMSMGVPIIAWDIKEWLDQGEAYRVPATSIPYWDERCGEVFFSKDELEETFSKFYATINEYDPKSFIRDNLSFSKTVEQLMEIFNAD